MYTGFSFRRMKIADQENVKVSLFENPKSLIINQIPNKT